MTVSTTLDRQYFPGDGANNNFPFNFRFFSNDQIYVSLIDDDGTVTPQTITTNYTLSGANAASGGAVTMIVPPGIDQTLFVQRILTLDQPTSIRNQGAFYPEIHENVFDRLTMLIQQLFGRIGRVLEFPASDPSTINTMLPQNTARANKVLAFDASGDPLISSLTLQELEQQPAGAAGSAAAAAASAGAAAGSASASASSALASSDSATLAQKWATNPENTPVITGFFSALHWAAKSAASAAAAAATLANAVLKTGAQTMAGPLTVTGGITSIPFNKEFISTEQTYSLAGGLSLPHGLGVSPKFHTTNFICKIAEAGYSVGDIVTLPSTQDATATYGVMVVPDATNVVIRFGASGVYVLNKASGTPTVTLTPANWRLILRAWA